ncbi:MAG: Pycsar system effector family protein [Sphingomonadaceae bacterium]
MAGQKFPPNAVHLVRTVEQINVQLSQMADQKASILMGATFVVFTISIGQARGGTLSVPLLVLAFFSFVSAMFAVFAVLPAIRPKPSATPNILFFGNFTRMSEQEFADSVIEHLHDEEALYRLMLRDVYQNGQVLQHKKYRFLGLAYRTFLVGLVLTFVSFIVTHTLYLG